MVDDNDAGTRADANATTAVGSPGMAETIESAHGDYLPFELGPAGYQLGALLGRGGMGEVIAAQDQRVGREVAYKRMRSREASGDALARFLREARIQARLDHPAIVPVYELGKDADGLPFFTMKRLVGQTLAERLADGAAPHQPLLRAFTDVCLAIEMAHSKGVVHRDLKPANIMLGDFGEVYVLDWGIARVLTQRARRPTGADPAGDLDSIGQATSGGTLLGTLGYMSPEQVRGEEVTGKADVYALGSILFELLCGEPLHPRGHAAVASTLAMESVRPAERTPDRAIAPELDELCHDMLVSDPARRPTARDVAARIQKYLDGDRDLEARKSLAAEHLALARAALASGVPQRRAEALREAGRALALDPHSRDAADLVTGIILEPPAELPAELAETLEAQDVALTRGRARRAITGFSSILTMTVLLVSFDISSWLWLGAIYASILAFIGVSYRTYKTGRVFLPGLLIGLMVMALVFSRLASPLVLVPALLCGTMLSVSNIPWLNDRPYVFYAWVMLCSLAPLVLELTGVVSQTTFVTATAIEIRSAVFAPSGWIALPSLALANVVLLLIVARFALLVARDRHEAQRRLTIQAWHLGQLLPETPQVIASPGPARYSSSDV